MNRAAAGMKVAVMMLMVLWMGADTAPTERASAASLRSSALNLSHHLKEWLLSPRAAGDDRSAKTTTRAASPDKRVQMMKMISALEELNRMFNSTLSSRITFLPRANSRNSGRKTKVPPPAEGGVRSTTAPPAAANSTVSRGSADAAVPSLTGRSFRKSLPPQTKKTNKRVCFWKYCSQN